MGLASDAETIYAVICTEPGTPLSRKWYLEPGICSGVCMVKVESPVSFLKVGGLIILYIDVLLAEPRGNICRHTGGYKELFLLMTS